MATTDAVGYVNNTPPHGLADDTGQRDRGPGHNLVTIDAVGEVAVIDLQRHGRELHRRNRLGLAGLQTQEARPLVDAFLNYPTESVVAMFAR